MKVRIKYFAGITRLKKNKNGDMIDLRCAEEVHLKEGQYYPIPLGVAMELPNDYEAHVYPRSSMFKNFGIIAVNSVGIIDNSYCGDNDQWHLLVYAMKDTVIPFDSRIAQFRIEHNQPDFDFEECECLGNNSRGGIGSTGVK